MRMKPPLFSRPAIGHSLAKGLIGCWLMNEGGGNIVNDSSGKGNIATPTGLNWRGRMLYWDSSTDKLVVTGKPVLLDNTKGTFIIRHKRTGAWGTYAALLRIDNIASNSSHEMRLHKYESGTSFSFRPNNDQDGATPSTKEWNFGDYSTFFLPDIWTTLAVTWHQNVSIVGYRDGIVRGSQVGSTAWNSSAFTNNEQLYIGKVGEANYTITGEVDYVMMYNRALSASEIQRLYMDPFCMFEEDM